MHNVVAEWQLRRNRVNHDWLKNQYLPALARFLNVLNDQVEDDEFEQQFATRVFVRWEEQSSVVQSLIADFERDMSPRQLFDVAPLARWPKSEAWLPEVAHQLWRVRNKVGEIVSQSQAAAEHASEAYRNLRRELPGPESGEELVERLRALRFQFAEFRDRCSELSKAIERFPRSILVT